MADKVDILEWREAVRKRPAMYIGSTGFFGITNLFHTLIKNTFHKTECNHFEIEVEGKMKGKLTFHNINSAIKNSINEDLSISAYDFAILNALSSKYQFRLYDKNEKVLLQQNYSKGELKKGKVDKKETNANSLEISFTLDSSIWEFNELRVLNFTDQIKDLAFLCSDKTFEIRKKPTHIVYNFKNGLLDKLEYESSKDYGFPNFINHSKHNVDNIKLELAFGLGSFYTTKKYLYSYVNFEETEDHGSHVIALTKGIKKALKKYHKKHLSDKNVLIRNSAIKKSLLGAIHIQIEKPSYWGPTRARLQNQEIIKPISKCVAETFLKILENDKEKAEEFIDRLSYV